MHVKEHTCSKLPLIQPLLVLLVLLAPACSSLTYEPGPKTLLGASFELPTGWSVERNEDFLLVQDPGKELKLWMVDIDGKTDADAIAAAWQLAVPGFARKPSDASSPPFADGWDSITEISYEVAAEESRAIAAMSRTKDGIAYVLLFDGSVPALQRRRAQLAQIVGSQKSRGFEKEPSPGKQAKALDEAMAATLDTFIEDARKKTRVPGAAISVLQGGKTVFERGYGTRRLGGVERVTPDTAFMIGSTTKPLTSLMMAVLVERGLFSWSTPIRDVLPGFRLADPVFTNKVEMRHSVCACTGLPRQDMEFVFEFDGVSPERRLAELATMKPTTGIGETFQYSNSLASAGGFAAAHARWPEKTLMDAYDKTMQETLFEPMGMASTTFSSQVAARGNHARPHGLNFRGDYEELPLSYEDWVVSIAPAGGAWSTVRDLARYVQLELAKGRLPDGKVLVSESGLLERRKPWIKTGPNSAYGLALGVSDGPGLRSVGHDGGTFGFSASVIFWPEHDLGLVILGNAKAADALNSVVRRKLLELVFDIDKEADKVLAYHVQRRDEKIGKELAKITLPPESAWITPLVGAYENEALGGLIVRQQGNGYVVDVGEWNSEVAKYSEAGQSTLVLVSPPVARLQLQVQDDGNLLLDAGQQKYVFKRKGHAQMRSSPH